MLRPFVGFISDHQPNDIQLRKLSDALIRLKSENVGLVMMCDVPRNQSAMHVGEFLGLRVVDSTDFERCAFIIGAPKNKRSRDRIIRKTVWDQLRSLSDAGKAVQVLYHDSSETLREFEVLQGANCVFKN